MSSENLTPFTEDQEKRLKGLCDKIHSGESVFIEVALAVRELKLSKLWQAKARSWEEFCAKEFPQSLRRVREWIQAADIINERAAKGLPPPPSLRKAVELARQSKAKTPDAVSPLSLNKTDSENQPESKTLKEEKPVPAKQPETAEHKQAPDLPFKYRAVIENNVKRWEHVSLWSDLSLQRINFVRESLKEAKRLSEFAHQTLPGMEFASADPSKRRPTLEEVRKYAKSLSICESDADAFYRKNQAVGWIVAGAHVRDWHLLLQNWNVLGYLPSKKQQHQQFGPAYTQPKGPTLSQKITKEVVDDVNRFLDKNNL